MKQKILSLLHEASLSHIADRFEPLIRQSVRINTINTDEDLIPIGASKIGGRPDLPPHLEWPESVDLGPIPFIGQINLSELPAEAYPTLPNEGILYFFYFDEIRTYVTSDYSGTWVEIDSQDGEEDFIGYVYEEPERVNSPLCRVYYTNTNLEELQRH
ncbi:DUF1963 domain-containing protein, partial [Robertmurraya sp.]|uniref:DUF1963 domain-containing protein n=1 Tax=Robertmurraya sp. TaxID=2837525 RepID=UPI003703AE4A